MNEAKILMGMKVIRTSKILSRIFGRCLIEIIDDDGMVIGGIVVGDEIVMGFVIGRHGKESGKDERELQRKT